MCRRPRPLLRPCTHALFPRLLTPSISSISLPRCFVIQELVPHRCQDCLKGCAGVSSPCATPYRGPVPTPCPARPPLHPASARHVALLTQVCHQCRLRVPVVCLARSEGLYPHTPGHTPCHVRSHHLYLVSAPCFVSASSVPAAPSPGVSGVCRPISSPAPDTRPCHASSSRTPAPVSSAPRY